jgi:hypothetical protein
MSEPTHRGKQQPDPDRDPAANADPERGTDEVQDETPDSTFSDPTAPVWADPTTPIPVPPTPPGPGQQPRDQPTAPPVAPPMINPYAQQTASPYPQQYGQPQSGQQYPAYSQQPYATGQHESPNASAIVLTVLSGVSLFVCNVLAIAPLVLGIVALTKNTTDHEASRRYAKIGWIVLAAVWLVAIVAIVALIVLSVHASNNPSNDMFGN